MLQDTLCTSLKELANAMRELSDFDIKTKISLYSQSKPFYHTTQNTWRLENYFSVWWLACAISFINCSRTRLIAELDTLASRLSLLRPQAISRQTQCKMVPPQYLRLRPLPTLTSKGYNVIITTNALRALDRLPVYRLPPAASRPCYAISWPTSFVIPSHNASAWWELIIFREEAACAPLTIAVIILKRWQGPTFRYIFRRRFRFISSL